MIIIIAAIFLNMYSGSDTVVNTLKYVNLFNSHSNPMREELLLCPGYRCAKQSTGRLKHLPGFIQLTSAGTCTILLNTDMQIMLIYSYLLRKIIYFCGSFLTFFLLALAFFVCLLLILLPN